MLIALVFALQTQAITPRPRPLTREQVAMAKFIAQVRRVEQVFLVEWRWEWQKNRDLKNTDPRYWSIHCHFDDPVVYGDELHLIVNAVSRKSMCPIWFQHEGTRPDESLTIDNGLPDDSRETMRRRRAEVLALLDSAAAMAPADAWVVGQRVRLNVDQRDFDRARLVAAKQCWSGPAFCAMLEGYVLFSSGNHGAAVAKFDSAAARMTPADRCGFLDISVFIPEEDRAAYEKRTCASRNDINERFWWLADPLFLQPGNERLAIHLFRQTMILLHSSLTADEHFDWRVSRGGAATAEMLLRYGWPSVFFYNREQDENHQRWLGFRDSSVNATREYASPRYHTTPSFAIATDFSGLQNADLSDLGAPWNDQQNAFDMNWWPIEHFSRAYLGTFDYQVAQFRRSRGPLVALATDARSPQLPDSVLRRYTAGLVAMSGPRDSARESSGSATVRADGATIMTIHTVPGSQVISAEFIDPGRDSAAAERARFAIDGAPGIERLGRREIALSDPVLFTAPAIDDSLPRGAPDAIERMLPSTTLRVRTRVGVFFEMYGVTRTDPIDMILTVMSEDRPGFLKRLGQRIGIADTAGASVAIIWKDGQSGAAITTTTIGGVVVQSRSIVLDLSALKPGRYAIEVGAGRSGEPAAVSRRDFTIQR